MTPRIDRVRARPASVAHESILEVERAVVSVRHLTEMDLARRWRVSPRTLQAWRWKGVGPVYLRVCGRIIYRVQDIIEYETNNLRQGTR